MKPSLTAEQKSEVVTRYIDGENVPELAAYFKVSNTPICRALKEAGVVTRQKATETRINEEVRSQIAAACAEGDKIANVARRFQIGRRLVTKILAERGVVARTGRPPSCELDHTAFDDMTKPEAAYWAGFLFADGSVVTDDGYGSDLVELGLSVKDQGHVEKFRDFLKSTHKICIITSHVGKTNRFGPDGNQINSGPTANLHVRSNRLTRALINHGMVSVKADRVPSLVLAKSHHFWRGLMDGDGGLGVTTKTSANGVVTTIPYISLNGQFAIVQAFADYLRYKQIADLKPARRSSIWCVGSGGPNIAVNIIRDLYTESSPVLSRKAKRAMDIINSPTTSDDKPIWTKTSYSDCNEEVTDFEDWFFEL